MNDLLAGSGGCLQPGMEVGEFTVMEFLGSGALGESYSAVGPSGTEDTVVHLVSPQRNSVEAMMDRMGELAERGRNIRNLHVLEIRDAQTDDFFNWVAFRKSDRISLRAIMAERRGLDHPEFSEKEVRRIVFQILLVLCVLHQRGLIHGALKPQHCFLDEDLHVEVADSGLYPLVGAPAHFGRPEEGVLTAEIPEFSLSVHAALESTLFAAPECALEANFSVESDLYAVGFLAWHLFTGHVRAGANFFYELPEPIRDGWGAWFLRATEPLPENRYHSAEEMLSRMPGVEPVEN